MNIITRGIGRWRRHQPRMCLAFCVVLATMLQLPVVAGTINKNTGTTGFSFLKLGVGSQATAMGGAYTALAGDASTIYYNPAGTVHLPGRQLMAGYHNYLMDIQSGFVALTLPASSLRLPDGKVGFFASYLNYGDFVRTDIDGVVTGDFSGGDLLLGANYSLRLKHGLSIGMNAKFMTERADGWSAEAVAADLGVMIRFKDSLTSAGMSLCNLGTVLSPFGGSGGHKDKLPLAFRAGVSHHPRGLPVVVSLDGVLPNDNDPYVNIGAELIRLKPLYLRAGYSTFGENYKTGSSNDGFGGSSFGFGLDAKLGRHNCHFAYAFMPYLDLGLSHRVTMTGEF